MNDVEIPEMPTDSVDYPKLRARISEFFGEKVAFSLCGPEDLDWEVVKKVANDNIYDESLDESENDQIDEYRKAGSLYSQIITPWFPTISLCKQTRAMSRNGTLPLLAAIMIEAGASPLLRFKVSRWSRPSLDSLIYSLDNFMAMKTLFIGKNIEQCFMAAFSKLAWEFDDRVAGDKLIFETYRHAFSEVDSPLSHISALLDMESSDQLLISSFENYRKIEIASGGYYSDSWTSRKYMEAGTLIAAAIWAIQGVAIENVVDVVIRRYELFVRNFCKDMKSDHLGELINIYRARLLGGYPDLWPGYGIKATHFLGCNLLKINEWRNEYSLSDKDYDTIFGTFYSMSLGLIHREGSDNGFSISAMSVLVKLCPEIMDINHVVYTGSREWAWYSKVKDISSVSAILNDMYLKEIWHPLTGRPELVSMMSREAKEKLLKEYLNQGSKALHTKALAVIEGGDIKIDDYFADLRLKKHFVNLSKIIVPTAEQAARIPVKYRKIFLNSQLDI